MRVLPLLFLSALVVACPPGPAEDDGGPEVPELIGGIYDPAVAHAQRMQSRETWIADLAGDNPTRRLIAVHKLGELGADGRVAVPAILALMNAPECDEQMRRQCVRTLGMLGGDEARTALATAMREAPAVDADIAADALGMLGEDAVPVIIPFLEDGNPRLRERGASALWAVLHKVGVRAEVRDAVLPVARLLDDEDAAVRQWALKILMELEERAAPALDHLAARLVDEPSADRRRWLILLLGLIGPDAVSAAPAMRAAVAADDLPGQSVLGVSLGRIGEIDDGRQRLERCLASDDAAVRSQAAGYLKQLGPVAIGSLPALEEALARAADSERRMIEAAIASVRGEH